MQGSEVKAQASTSKGSVSYTSLCAAFESNADHILIEAWRKLGMPDEQISVLIGTSTVTGSIRKSRTGAVYASESRWISGQREHPKANKLANKSESKAVRASVG